MIPEIAQNVAAFVAAIKADDQKAGMAALGNLIAGALSDLRRIADAAQAAQTK